jgi:hypothetical protein
MPAVYDGRPPGSLRRRNDGHDRHGLTLVRARARHARGGGKPERPPLRAAARAAPTRGDGSRSSYFRRAFAAATASRNSADGSPAGSVSTESNASPYHFSQAAITSRSTCSAAFGSFAAATIEGPCCRSSARRRAAAPSSSASTARASASSADARNHADVATRHADVLHRRRAGLVGRVLVGVVVAIGEVPVEQRRHAGVREHGVVAAPLVRIGPHDPAGVGRAAARDGEWTSFSRLPRSEPGLDVAPPPLAVRIRRARPDGGRIRLLLDEERPAGLRRVLPGHVERHHVADLLRRGRVGRDPLAAAADLVEPEERQRTLGGGSAPAGWPPAAPAQGRRGSPSRSRCRWRRAPARGRRARSARPASIARESRR